MTQRIGEPLSEWTHRASSIGSKRIYDRAEASDGRRILATQYWPRGIARESVDEYVRNLAPSRDLLHAYRNGDLSWPEYSRQYLEQMQGEGQQAEIHRLAKLARSANVTVLCVCPDESICHRSLLRELIAAFDGEA